MPGMCAVAGVGRCEPRDGDGREQQRAEREHGEASAGAGLPGRGRGLLLHDPTTTAGAGSPPAGRRRRAAGAAAMSAPESAPSTRTAESQPAPPTRSTASADPGAAPDRAARGPPRAPRPRRGRERDPQREVVRRGALTRARGARGRRRGPRRRTRSGRRTRGRPRAAGQRGHHGVQVAVPRVPVRERSAGQADAEQHDRAGEVQHVVGAVERQDVRAAAEEEQADDADQQVDRADGRVRGLGGRRPCGGDEQQGADEQVDDVVQRVDVEDDQRLAVGRGEVEKPVTTNPSETDEQVDDAEDVRRRDGWGLDMRLPPGTGAADARGSEWCPETDGRTEGAPRRIWSSAGAVLWGHPKTAGRRPCRAHAVRAARSPEVPQQRRPAQVRVPGWFGSRRAACRAPRLRGALSFVGRDDRWHHHRKDCHGEAGQGSRCRRAHGPVP